MVGSSIPGIPLIMIGRTKHIAWGITAPMTDVSDLFREQIKNGKYLLDGEWRPLKVKTHEIKVKGLNETEKFDLQFTHRGPVMSSSVIGNA